MLKNLRKTVFIKTVFFVFLSLIFLFEGLGLSQGRQISYFLILAMPVFLFLTDFIDKKPIMAPKKLLAIFGLFLFFSTISTVFAVNIQHSFEYLIYYLAVFLIFIYVFNHKELLKPLIAFIFTMSFIFITYSTFINHFLPKGWNTLIPARGYQYVYAFYKTHNPLGTFLLIPIVLSFSLFITEKKNRYLWPFFVILPFFLLSYSRSAYLAFIIGSLILLTVFIRLKKTRLVSAAVLVSFCVLLISTCLFFLTVKYPSPPPIVKIVNNYLSTRLGLPDKTFTSEREHYFNFAWLSFKEKPLFGLGPGNFVYATYKFAASKSQIAETADNIFLEMFSENGLLAGAVFVWLMILLIKNANRKKLAFLVAFLTMLLLFQTDSSQRYFSYLLLFFIIAGVIYEEKSLIEAKFIPLACSAILWMIVGCMLINSWLISQNIFRSALYFYPLNQPTYQYLLMNTDNNGWLWPLYQRLFDGDPDALMDSGFHYLKIGDQEKALVFLKKSFQAYPYSYLTYKTMFQLENKFHGEKSARILATQILNKLTLSTDDDDYNLYKARQQISKLLK